MLTLPILQTPHLAAALLVCYHTHNFPIHIAFRHPFFIHVNPCNQLCCEHSLSHAAYRRSLSTPTSPFSYSSTQQLQFVRSKIILIITFSMVDLCWPHLKKNFFLDNQQLVKNLLHTVSINLFVTQKRTENFSKKKNKSI